jgi:hypothetical protein
MGETQKSSLKDLTITELEAKIDEGLNKFKEIAIKVIEANRLSESSFDAWKKSEIYNIENFILTRSLSTSDNYNPNPKILLPALSYLADTLYFKHYIIGENVINLILDTDYLKTVMYGTDLGNQGFGVLNDQGIWQEINLISLQNNILASFIDYAIAIKKMDYLLGELKYPTKQTKKPKKFKKKPESKAPEFIGIDIPKLVNYLSDHNIIELDNPISFFNKEDYEDALILFKNKKLENKKININGQENFIGSLLYAFIKNKLINCDYSRKKQIILWVVESFTWGFDHKDIKYDLVSKNLSRKEYSKESRRLHSINLKPKDFLLSE